jgi:hypothetical protein
MIVAFKAAERLYLRFETREGVGWRTADVLGRGASECCPNDQQLGSGLSRILVDIRPSHSLSVPHKTISQCPLVSIVHKRDSGELRRAAREVHLRQIDVKRPYRRCASSYDPEVVNDRSGFADQSRLVVLNALVFGRRPLRSGRLGN